jgi:hypothetical protein
MRYLPFRPGSFASVIWDPPYAMHRRQTMPCLIELRGMLSPGGRLIVVHYFDPVSYSARCASCSKHTMTPRRWVACA